MACQLHTEGKKNMLVYSKKRFSSTDIISIKNILEGIHLCWYISMISYNNTILKLILVFETLQELRNATHSI